MKKIYLFIFLVFASLMSSFAQSVDSIQINKSVLLFYDSSDYVPVVSLIPYPEIDSMLFHVQYENLGANSSQSLLVEFNITHTNFPNGGVGLGLIYSKIESLGQLAVGEKDTLRSNECTPFTAIGGFDVEFKIMGSLSNDVLDSSNFFFEIGDTIISKHTSISNPPKTGPSFFTDTLTNQPGGTVVGDRYATLFEVNGRNVQYFNVPTSVSFFISMDSNNIGVEFVPKIWELNEDSIGTPNFIGPVVASSFIPETLQVSSLGQYRSFIFDNGTGVFNGLPKGKYAVGFESTLPMPNGKSLILGRDTIAEKVQVENTSYVSFGQNTDWYLINDLPMIRLNLGQLPIGGGASPCNFVGLDEKEVQVELNVYPNPTNGRLQIESDRQVEKVRVFNVKGQLVLERDQNHSSINLADQAKGLYLLRIQFENGTVVNEKLILE